MAAWNHKAEGGHGVFSGPVVRCHYQVPIASGIKNLLDDDLRCPEYTNRNVTTCAPLCDGHV